MRVVHVISSISREGGGSAPTSPGNTRRKAGENKVAPRDIGCAGDGE